MSVDPVNLNNQPSYPADSAANKGVIRFDPTQIDLAGIKSFNNLPKDVQTTLNSTGAYSLDPISGWTKTELADSDMVKLFGGNTIYTPNTPNQMAIYQALFDVNILNQTFNNFVLNFYSDTTETDGQDPEDSYDGLDPYTKQDNPQNLTSALMSLLQGQIKS
jgi:hypothetical protein